MTTPNSTPAAQVTEADRTIAIDALNFCSRPDNETVRLDHEAYAQLIAQHRAEAVAATFPNIGPDPLAHSDQVKGGVEGARERLEKVTALQQTGVPDQTGLVWRIDLDRLLCDHTWRCCHLESLRKANADNADLHRQLSSAREETQRLRLQAQRISDDFTPAPGQEAMALQQMREAIGDLAGTEAANTEQKS